MKLRISKHAIARMNQRGIRKVDIELLVAHADIAIPCGNGRISYSMTKKGLNDLLLAEVPVQVADRLRSICAIVAEDGTIVSVMKLHGHKGKRYRRDKQFDRRKNASLGGLKWAM